MLTDQRRLVLAPEDGYAHFSVAWGDVDGDGDLDLAVGNYGQPNRLYRNDGGVLTDQRRLVRRHRMTVRAPYSVAWGDVDGDGDLDLAVGNNGQPNRLYRNDGGVLTTRRLVSAEAKYKDGTEQRGVGRCGWRRRPRPRRRQRGSRVSPPAVPQRRRRAAPPPPGSSVRGKDITTAWRGVTWTATATSTSPSAT